MTTCEALCASIAGGVGTLPLPADTDRIWAAVRKFVKEPSALLMVLRRTKEKAGESPGAFLCPGRHNRPQCGRFRETEAGAFSERQNCD